jgi:S1-C subfamily serine protease
MHTEDWQNDKRSGAAFPEQRSPRGTKPRSGRLLITVILISALTGGLAGAALGYWTAQTSVPRGGPADPAAFPAIALDQSALDRNPDVPTVEREVVEEESATISAVQRVQPAVVTILNQGNLGFGSGSGVIISEDGYIITNDHVVSGARELGIIFSDGRQVEAVLIGTFELTDLAVIRVDGSVPAVAALGDSDALQPGARVIAIGSPLGRFQNSVTTGIVSALNRQVSTLTGLIQTDAPINQGNSGGPLLNSAGQVVGINTLVVRGDMSDAEGLGFAVPSNTVQAVADQLIANGKVERPFLGISFRPVDPNEASELGVTVGEGVIVEQIEAGSPVAEAGLQADDIIVGIGGHPIDANTSVLNLMLRFRVGQQVVVDIVRDGHADTLKVTLGAFPEEV